MVKIQTFQEAIEEAQDISEDMSVLLGNGFSIEYDHSIFAYDSLAAEARFAGLSQDASALFSELGSSNFEVVIDKLRAASKLQNLYGGSAELAQRLDGDARVIAHGLADALATRHPDNAATLDDDEVMHARAFLSPFLRVFTLSYDLLLYWVTNRDLFGSAWVSKTDGFEWPSYRDRDRLVWKPKPSRPQHVFFLHGALHYFVEDARLTKLHMGYGSSIVSGLRAKLDAEEYPLVVTEGTRDEKLARIERSAYLKTGLRRFGELQGVLFLHGLSLSSNDNHIFELIEADTSQVHTIYVSLHGDGRDGGSRQVIDRAKEMKAHRRLNGGSKLRVRFYDASSANVWRDN